MQAKINPLARSPRQITVNELVGKPLQSRIVIRGKSGKGSRTKDQPQAEENSDAHRTAFNPLCNSRANTLLSNRPGAISAVVAQQLYTLWVGGSNPSSPTIPLFQ